MKRLDEGLKRAALVRARRSAIEDASHFGSPLFQSRDGSCRIRFQIHCIVDRPAHIEDGGNRAAFGGRQDEKRVVEAGLSGHEVTTSGATRLLLRQWSPHPAR